LIKIGWFLRKSYESASSVHQKLVGYNSKISYFKK
jgi:hypothetical protein